MRSRIGTGLVAAAVVAALLAVWPRLVAAGDGSQLREVAGRVRGLHGATLGDAAVTLFTVEAGAERLLARGWTDADGRFALDATARGTLQVEVAAGGYAAARWLVDADPLDVRLSPLAAIDGCVLDHEGAPAASVRLVAVAVDDPTVRVTAWSRWDGTFRLRVPPDRRFVVEGVTAAGRRVRQGAAVAAGAAPLALRLQR